MQENSYQFFINCYELRVLCLVLRQPPRGSAQGPAVQDFKLKSDPMGREADKYHRQATLTNLSYETRTERKKRSRKPVLSRQLSAEFLSDSHWTAHAAALRAGAGSPSRMAAGPRTGCSLGLCSWPATTRKEDALYQLSGMLIPK